MNKSNIIFMFLASALIGCTVGPDYEKPETKTLQKWKDSTEITNLKITNDKSAVKTEWWKNFSDPILDDLITQAEKNNYDIKIATARLMEARASRLAELSSLFPEISGDIKVSRANRPFGSLQIINNSYESGFDASWELDIFGGQKRRLEAAKAETQSVAANLENVLISLRSEVALGYVEYRNLQNRIIILKENIKSLEDTANLTKQKFQYGVASAADVAQINSSLSLLRASLPRLENAIELAKNNLTTMIGILPGELDARLADRKPIPVADMSFLISTPAEAIAARPDVKSAERQLAAATALQGAAIANLFPKISLGGFFGLQDTSLSDRTRLWSLSSDILIPIFSVGKVRSQIKSSDANQEAALAIYEKSVVAALAEIQTYLTSYVNNEVSRTELSKAVGNEKQSLKLAFARYEKGEYSLLEVFEAEQSFYNAKNQLTDAEAEVAKSLISLNKSLGR